MFPPVMVASKRPSETAAHAASPSEESSGISLQGKRAVIAEDEGLTQLQLRRILRSEGMDVVGLASNGQEAVEIVLQQRPDVVLMDIRMPMMDGLQASRRILEQFRVCIVILTAFSDEETQQEAREIGACGYVFKPVTAALLIPRLKAALQEYSRQTP